MFQSSFTEVRQQAREVQTIPRDHLDAHGDTMMGPSVTQAIPQGLYRHQKLPVGLQEPAPTSHQQHPNSPANHLTMTPQSLRPWSATKAEIQQLNNQISAARNARGQHLEQIRHQPMVQKDHSDQFSKYHQAFQENMKTFMIGQAIMRQYLSRLKTTNVTGSPQLLTPTGETLVQDGTSPNLARSDIKIPQNPAPSQTPQEQPEDRDQKDLKIKPIMKPEPLTIIRLKPNQAFGLSPKAYQKFKELRHKQARIVLKRLPLRKLLEKNTQGTSRPSRLVPVAKKLCLPWPIESAKNTQSGNDQGPIRKKSNKIPAPAEDKLQRSTLSDGCTKYGSPCGIKHPAEETKKSQPEPWPVMPASNRSNTPDQQTESTATSFVVVEDTMNTVSKSNLNKPQEALEQGSPEDSSNTIKQKDSDSATSKATKQPNKEIDPSQPGDQPVKNKINAPDKETPAEANKQQCALRELNQFQLDRAPNPGHNYCDLPLEQTSPREAIAAMNILWNNKPKRTCGNKVKDDMGDNICESCGPAQFNWPPEEKEDFRTEIDMTLASVDQLEFREAEHQRRLDSLNRLQKNITEQKQKIEKQKAIDQYLRYRVEPQKFISFQDQLQQLDIDIQIFKTIKTRLEKEIRDIQEKMELRKEQSKIVIEELAKRISWIDSSFKVNSPLVLQAAKDILLYLYTPAVNMHPQLMSQNQIQDVVDHIQRRVRSLIYQQSENRGHIRIPNAGLIGATNNYANQPIHLGVTFHTDATPTLNLHPIDFSQNMWEPMNIPWSPNRFALDCPVYQIIDQSWTEISAKMHSRARATSQIGWKIFIPSAAPQKQELDYQSKRLKNKQFCSQ